MALFVVAAWPPQTPASEWAVPALSAYPWLYLRDGESLMPSEPVVEVIAVGDVMLGRGVADQLHPAPDEGLHPLAAVAPWLQAADVTLGNLECVIAEGGSPRPGPYRLRAPLLAATTLRDAGFDVLGLANNHALDFGPAALAETVSRLQQAGIAAVGVGHNADAALQPLSRAVDGVQFAFLAFNNVPDPEDDPAAESWTPARWDREGATAAIAAARTQADVVIVSVHWGYEYDLRADPSQRTIAQAMLDAGADLVIGHHPHVVQDTALGLRGFSRTSEARGDGFVAYSLGNLVFDQQREQTRQGLALRVFFDQEGLRAVQALPLWAGPQPRLMARDEAASLLGRVGPDPLGQALSATEDGPRQETVTYQGKTAAQQRVYRTGFACKDEACHPVDVRQTLQAERFHAGEIDLSGDGVPELVQREGEQVVIYQGGVEVWRGRPEWGVVDVALGDPNDDGRGEVLLALRKPDSEGVVRSQPFIIGFRGGVYRVLWGGSAVADPIREVELGDVDGDGMEELVVLEEWGDGRTVSVWRWHGWGFILVWRSTDGSYRDLALVPGEAGTPPAISVATERAEATGIGHTGD